MKPPKHFVNIDNVNIHYVQGKSGVRPDRATLVFLHGAGGNALRWNRQKAHFQKQFNVVIPDLPGHRLSDPIEKVTIPNYAQVVKRIIAELDLNNVFLIGHSMGGAIAQHFAIRNPDLLKGIVLVGTGAKLRVMPEVITGLKENFDETVEYIVKHSFASGVSPALISLSINEMKRCNPTILYDDCVACDDFDMMGEVAKISVPTLVVCGAEDKLAPIKYSEFLQEKIPNAKLKILPQAGHEVMNERFEQFNEVLEEFVNIIMKHG